MTELSTRLDFAPPDSHHARIRPLRSRAEHSSLIMRRLLVQFSRQAGKWVCQDGNMNYESLARNRVLGWLGRPAVRLVHAVDPTRFRLREFNRVAPRDSALLCVYRQKNSRLVVELVNQASELDMAVALWALDSPSASLAARTVGSGPGPRLNLLNRLSHSLPASAGGHLVVCDDDILFERGGLRELLFLTTVCNFGLAQPAHAPRSYVNHAITRARPLTLARVTTYVESGPVVVISPEWRGRVLPFPEELGMGWGVDLLWSDLQKIGCRLGIVDGVSLRHLAPPARGYDVGPEAERLRVMMKTRGIESLHAFQRTLGAWRTWQTEPPWTARRGG